MYINVTFIYINYLKCIYVSLSYEMIYTQLCVQLLINFNTLLKTLLKIQIVKKIQRNNK